MNIEAILSDLIAIKTDNPLINNQACVDYISKHLAQENILFKRVSYPNDVKENILAGINVDKLKDIEGGLVLSGHMDTVPAKINDWETNPYQATPVNGKIYGRGTVDMKQFLAVVLSVLPALKKVSYPIFLLFSSDEETNVRGITALTKFLSDNHIKPTYALVGEPTNFNICVANRGYAGFTTKVQGLSAHSCYPRIGTNAIYIVAKIVSFIEKLNNEYEPKGITLNVGTIRGGEGRNSIPAEVSIDWEIRYAQKEAFNKIFEKIEAYHQTLLSAYPNSKIVIETKENLPSFERKNNDRLSCLAQKLLQTTFIEMPLATECGFLQEIGIETIMCGPGDEKLAHSACEFIRADDLKKYKDFLLKFTQLLEDER